MGCRIAIINRFRSNDNGYYRVIAVGRICILTYTVIYHILTRHGTWRHIYSPKAIYCKSRNTSIINYTNGHIIIIYGHSIQLIISKGISSDTTIDTAYRVTAKVIIYCIDYACCNRICIITAVIIRFISGNSSHICI